MEKTVIRADYSIASDLMDSIYALYMAIVESMGGDPNNPNIRKEGESYAGRKFLELTDEFENTLPMQWVWMLDEEDEE